MGHTKINPAQGAQSPAGLETSKGAGQRHFNLKHSNKFSAKQVPRIREVGPPSNTNSLAAVNVRGRLNITREGGGS